MTAAHLEHVTFISSAITCGQCVAKVEQAARQIDGVTSVHANAETRFVDVDFDPSMVTADAVAEHLAKAGYPVRA